MRPPEYEFHIVRYQFTCLHPQPAIAVALAPFEAGAALSRCHSDGGALVAPVPRRSPSGLFSPPRRESLAARRPATRCEVQPNRAVQPTPLRVPDLGAIHPANCDRLRRAARSFHNPLAAPRSLPGRGRVCRRQSRFTRPQRRS